MIDSSMFEITSYAIASVCVILLAWFFRAFAVFRLRKAIRKLVNFKNLGLILPGYKPSKNRIKFLFSSMAMICLAVAFLRPKWGKREQEVLQEGRNIMISLDMSRSMLAKDLMPNRLEFVKLKLRELFSRLGPERVGLILFSDKAFLHCPLTNDSSAFFSFIDQACGRTVSSGGTSINKALVEASQSFNRTLPDSKNRLLFLITDGEDFSEDIKQGINAAKAAGIRVIILGAATEQGAPVPTIDSQGRQTGHEKDRLGNIVMTKLNPSLLDDIASSLDGNFVVISEDDSDIENIVKLIESFEKDKSGVRSANLYEERQNIFSFMFLIFMLLEWFF